MTRPVRLLAPKRSSLRGRHHEFRHSALFRCCLLGRSVSTPDCPGSVVKVFIMIPARDLWRYAQRGSRCSRTTAWFPVVIYKYYQHINQYLTRPSLSHFHAEPLRDSWRHRSTLANRSLQRIHSFSETIQHCCWLTFACSPHK